MDEALKPCPFCGSPPMPDYCSTTDGPAYSFHCHAKDCPAWPNVQGETEAEAIAAWNTRADAAPTPRADEVEAVARAICATRGLSPDALYQHHEWEPWPIDRRDEYVGLGGEVRINLMHYAWRHHTERAQAAIAALDAARGDPVARVVEWLRKENGLCDCHARCETECGCGAWDDWKTKPLLEIADAIERGEPFNG